MEYKFHLQKYKNRESFMICPNCNKKEFKPYVVEATGEIIHPTCGRCNREDNCGYHYPPKAYFADNPTNRAQYRSIKRLYAPVPKVAPPIDTLPFCEVEKGVERTINGQRSTFLEWIERWFDSQEIFERLTKDYYLTPRGKNDTIFWQIDLQLRVRTGQALRHQLQQNEDGSFIDCKRVHDQPPMWMHKIDGSTKAYNLKQCLFGEHLLGIYPDYSVALVEGQKNAVIGRGIAPNYIWIATCSEQNFKADMLSCLAGRNVVLFPDIDAHDEWCEKAKVLSQKIGFKYDIFTGMVDIATSGDRAQKLDIADYLLGKFELQSDDQQFAST